MELIAGKPPKYQSVCKDRQYENYYVFTNNTLAELAVS